MGTSRRYTKLLCSLLGAVVWSTALSAEKPTVISLSPAATELIYEMKLDTHLIAVDQNSNFPEQAKQLPNIGDPFNPNMELLAQFQPDLLIHFSRTQVLDTAKKTLNLTLFPMQPKSMEELFEQANQLASTLYQDRSAQITQWRQQWQAINQKYNSSPSANIQQVFVFLGANPIYTLGKKAFLSKSLHACGVRSLFDEQDFSSLMVSEEQLLITPPDKVLAGIAANEDSQSRRQQIIETFKKLGIPLSQEQVILVNQDILFRPSIRFLNYLPSLCEQLQTL
ncbi:MAG: ABC transporter substrate-binding protein [Pelistega sp.]|nr:ABC transporter substrate-binding protein [Pelistega sp.]